MMGGNKIDKEIKRFGRSGWSNMGKRKDMFIGDNMARNNNSTRDNVKAVESFVITRITQKHTGG